MSNPTFPFDPLGTSPSNLVQNETQLIGLFANTNYAVVIADYAPFYSSSLIVQYTPTSGSTVTLTEGADYTLILPYLGATRSLTIPVYGGIALSPAYTSGSVKLAYQTLGWNWVGDKSLILPTLAQPIYNPKTALWDAVTNIKSYFPQFNTNKLDGNIVAQIPGEFVLGEPAATYAPLVNGLVPVSNIPVNAFLVAVNTPNILTPASQSIFTNSDITFIGSDFSANVLQSSFTIAHWQIATDTLFTSIVVDTQTTINKLTLTNQLLLGNVYYARVRYTDNQNNVSNYSSPIILILGDIATPAIIAPTTLSTGNPTTVIFQGSAFVSSVPNDSFKQSNWQIATDSAFATIVQTTSIAGTVWNATNLAPGRTYYARVSYQDTYNNVSAFSNTISFSVGSITTPTISASGSTISDAASNVPLSGSAFVSTVTNSALQSSTWQVSLDLAFINIVQTYSTTTTNVTVAGLTNNSTYYVRVMYQDQFLQSSSWSLPVTINTGFIQTPNITAPLAASTTSSTSVNFTASIFSSTVTNDSISSAQWEVATDNAFVNIAATVTGPAYTTAWAVNNLTAGTAYYVRVQYTGTSGFISNWSPVIPFNILAVNQPSITSPISNTASLSNSINIVGSAFSSLLAGDAFSESTWEIATDTAFTNIVINTTISNTSFIFATAAPNTTYYARVRYTGTSLKQSIWSVTTAFTTGFISTPSILNYTNGSITSFITPTFVSSAFSSNIIGDTIKNSEWQFATDAAFTQIVFDSTITSNPTSYTSPNLTAGTSYYVRVRYNSNSDYATSWSSSILISATTVQTPTIVTPATNQTNVGSDITVTSSAFVGLISGITLSSVIWELATDSAFSTIVQTVNGTSLTWNIAGLAVNATYYVRVQYTASTNISSAWSTPLIISTGYISTPSIVTPINATVVTSPTVNFTASNFTTSISNDTLQSAIWQIATDNAFTNIITSSSGSTNLASWSVTDFMALNMAANTTYYVRMAYVSSTAIQSSWSPYITFTIVQIIPPTITSPVNGYSLATSAITITGSTFSSISPGETLASVSWELATDSAFTQNLVTNITTVSTWNLTGLTTNTVYYVRVKYTGSTGVVSSYGAANSFTTKINFSPSSIIQQISSTYPSNMSADGSTVLVSNLVSSTPGTLNSNLTVYEKSGSSYALSVTQSYPTANYSPGSASLSYSGTIAYVGSYDVPASYNTSPLVFEFNYSSSANTLTNSGSITDSHTTNLTSVSIRSISLSNDGATIAYVMSAQSNGVPLEYVEIYKSISGIMTSIYTDSNTEVCKQIAISGDGSTCAYMSNAGVNVVTVSGSIASLVQTINSSVVNQNSLGTSAALSLNGSTLVIGSPYDNTETGNVYVYTHTSGSSGASGSYSLTQTIPGPSTTSNFGMSVAISQDASTIMIGAPGYNSNTGIVYFYTYNGSTWVQSAMIAAPAVQASFGMHASISENGTIGYTTDVNNGYILS